MRNHWSHIVLFAMNQLKMDFLQENHQILRNFKFDEMNLICDCCFDDVNFSSAYCHTMNCQSKEIRELEL